MPSAEVPELLRSFDSETLGRLRGQAKTIVAVLLAYQRNFARTRHWRKPIHFPRGTTEFSILHTLVADAPTLIALLNDTLGHMELTDGLWRFSPGDPTLILHTNDSEHMVILHPQGVDVSSLDEVPDDVRIYQLSPRPPFEVHEAAIQGREAIARERATRNTPLGQIHAQQWRVIIGHDNKTAT